MGVVYVLTNPAMPGLVKIGHTSQPVKDRMRSLNSTGVPYPYDCAAAWEFRDHVGVEKALHRAFADCRVSEKEFFKMDPKRVMAILEQFGRKDVTPPRSSETGTAVTNPPRSKRQMFRFSMVGIEPGVVLTSVWDESVTCTVVDDRRVQFVDEVMTLSAAAKRVIRGRGKNWKSVAGPDSWCYGDPPRTLNRLRDEKRL